MDPKDSWWRWRLRPRNGKAGAAEFTDYPESSPIVDGRTAQVIYGELVKDTLSPALRALGFTGSGGTYALKSQTHWAQLGLQKSSYSDRAEVRFTANLSVVSKADWDAFRAKHPAMPAKPAASMGYGAPVDDGRLGTIAGGEDKWWIVKPTGDHEAVVADFVADLTCHGLPWLQARMSDG